MRITKVARTARECGLQQLCGATERLGGHQKFVQHGARTAECLEPRHTQFCVSHNTMS